MHPLEKETYNVCHQPSLFAPGDLVVMGVSGGADSMAMMHVLAGLSEKLGISLIAAHFNHCLRPGEDERETALVDEQANTLGLIFEMGSIKVKELAMEANLCVEEAARNARYDFFNQLLEKHSANRIAVAHTADDQAEEVLLRLIRGAGLKGLSGMDVARGQVVRPFLGFSKRRLIAYLADRSLPYMEDSSNTETIYLRNRVRLELLPYLADNFNPNIQQTLRQTAKILHDEDIFLEEITQQACVCAVSGDGQMGIYVDLPEFEGMAVAVKRRVVERCILDMGIKPGFKQIDSLLRLAAGAASKQVHLASGLRVWKEKQRMIFDYPKGKTSERGNLFSEKEHRFEITVEGPGVYEILELGMKVEFRLIQKEILKEDELKKEAVDVLNFDQLNFPLVIRSRRVGDRFHPLGGSGSKKVSNFLGDMKMPCTQRDKVPILACAERIVALLGVRIDHDFRVVNGSKDLLVVVVDPL